jgi:hypothetical protein
VGTFQFWLKSDKNSKTLCISTGSRDSAVGIVARLRGGRSAVRIPAGESRAAL